MSNICDEKKVVENGMDIERKYAIKIMEYLWVNYKNEDWYKKRR